MRGTPTVRLQGYGRRIRKRGWIPPSCPYTILQRSRESAARVVRAPRCYRPDRRRPTTELISSHRAARPPAAPRNSGTRRRPPRPRAWSTSYPPPSQSLQKASRHRTSARGPAASTSHCRQCSRRPVRRTDRVFVQSARATLEPCCRYRSTRRDGCSDSLLATTCRIDASGRVGSNAPS